MVKQFRRLPPEEYEKHGIYPPQEFDGEIAWYVHPPDYDPHRLHWLALAFFSLAAARALSPLAIPRSAPHRLRQRRHRLTVFRIRGLPCTATSGIRKIWH